MKLVSLADYGIKSMNYYWERRDSFDITVDELKEAGVTGDFAEVDEAIIPKLIEANQVLEPQGYELIVKDGYRSPELYKLVQAKRYINDGKEATDRTLNLVTMPHATGLVVDLNLIDLNTGQEVEIRDKADWPNSIFVDYYRGKKDAKSVEFQRLQDLLTKTMFELGFKHGSMKEFHHFEWNGKI